MFHLWLLEGAPVEYKKEANNSVAKAREHFMWDLLPKPLVKILETCLNPDPSKRASMHEAMTLIHSTITTLVSWPKEKFQEGRDMFKHHEGMFWGGCRPEDNCVVCEKEGENE